MAENRGQRLGIFAILAFLAIYFLNRWRSNVGFTSSNSLPTGPILDYQKLPAANSTLGFGAVVAVSRATSPRQESLILAANITEIDITIPSQPSWTDADLMTIVADHGSQITRGSALAWLGHLNVLRWFLNSTLSTILILEDDVDWDIHLRTTQIPAVAATTRQLLSSPSQKRRAVLNPSAAGTYWGPTDSWDILYLGHCGDNFRPSRWNFATPRLAFRDPTLPLRKDLHSDTSKFLDAIEVPEYVRLVHQSMFPLCTFGFALTRSSAARLLTELAVKERDGGTQAYDVRVLEACRDEGLRCWSTNPELFHHMDAPSEIAIVNSAGAAAETKTTEAQGRLVGAPEGQALNIKCGVRSKEFFTRDQERMEYLRQVVGREGKCLRDDKERD